MGTEIWDVTVNDAPVPYSYYHDYTLSDIVPQPELTPEPSQEGMTEEAAEPSPEAATEPPAEPSQYRRRRPKQAPNRNRSQRPNPNLSRHQSRSLKKRPCLSPGRSRNPYPGLQLSGSRNKNSILKLYHRNSGACVSRHRLCGFMAFIYINLCVCLQGCKRPRNPHGGCKLPQALCVCSLPRKGFALLFQEER